MSQWQRRAFQRKLHQQTVSSLAQNAKENKLTQDSKHNSGCEFVSMERLCWPADLEGLRHCRKADSRRLEGCFTRFPEVVGVYETNYDYFIILSCPRFKFKQCCHRQCSRYGIYSDKNPQCGHFFNQKIKSPSFSNAVRMNYYCRKKQLICTLDRIG